MQLRQLEQERRRTFDAVLHLRDGRVVQLATEEIPSVNVALRGDGDDSPSACRTCPTARRSRGARAAATSTSSTCDRRATLLLEYQRGNAALSPEGRYLTWFDGEQQAWFAMDLAAAARASLNGCCDEPVRAHSVRRPQRAARLAVAAGSYGSAGWTTGDTHFLIYDRHDIWAVDPTGGGAAQHHRGRRPPDNLRFRYVRRQDPEERAIDPVADMLLSAFHSGPSGRLLPRPRQRHAPPVRLIMTPLGSARRARREDADVLMLTRSRLPRVPRPLGDRPRLRNMRRLSDANPQQDEYRWGTAELVTGAPADGDLLQGVLYKPEDFDPSRKYPMMVYFYERLSDNLHNHVVPAAGSSSINISFYVSRGYLVFTPDIPYRIGYPGESAYNAVVPGRAEPAVARLRR
jgi:hypothetical protein